MSPRIIAVSNILQNEWTQFANNYFPAAEVNDSRLVEMQVCFYAGVLAHRTVMCSKLPVGMTADQHIRLVDGELRGYLDSFMQYFRIPPARP